MELELKLGFMPPPPFAKLKNKTKKTKRWKHIPSFWGWSYKLSSGLSSSSPSFIHKSTKGKNENSRPFHILPKTLKC
jgi:hypothetical protein